MTPATPPAADAGLRGSARLRRIDIPPAPAVFAARDLLLAPNVLSLLRIPLAVVFPFASKSLAAAGVVLALAGATDVFDGWLARRRGQTTAIGAVVDPIADKVFAVSVVVTLLRQQRLPLWAIPALLAREILEAPLVLWVIATRARRREPLPETRANVPGKVATTAQFVAVLAALAAPEALPLALGAAALTAGVAGVAYWVRELRRTRGARPPSA